MALTIKFGTIKKRINSTYQAMDEQLTCDVVLKNNTSIVNPTFIIHCAKTEDVTALLKCNYCNGLQAGLHRYYWIDDIVCTSGNNGGGSNIFEVHCHVDVLASMYDYIKDETHFVKYTGDVTKADLQIDDERLAPEIPLNEGPTTLLESTPFGQDWTYIIKVKVLATGAGTSLLYAVNKANFDKLMDNWITKSGLDNVTDYDSFVDAATAHLGGISNNVSDFLEDWWLIWINPGQFGTMNDPVQMGTWVTDAKGKLLGYTEAVLKGNYEKTIHVPNPIPSDTNILKMHFLKSKKYTQLMLKSASGTSDISTDSFVLSNSGMKVQIKYILGLITGECVFELWDKNTSSFLGSTTANLKICPITNVINGGGTDDASMKALGSMGRLALQLGATTSAISTAAFQSNIAKSQTLSESSKQNIINTAQTQQDITNNLTSIGTGIIGALGSTPRSGSMGGGSFSGSVSGFLMQMMNLANENYNYNAFVTVIGYFNIPAVCADINSYNNYAIEHGYPCSRMLKLSTLLNNTFLQCSMADVLSASTLKVGFTPREICEFNNFLNTGIFIDASTGKKSDLDPEEARKHLPGVVDDVR